MDTKIFDFKKYAKLEEFSEEEKRNQSVNKLLIAISQKSNDLEDYSCPHLEQKNLGEDCPDCQTTRYKIVKNQFERLFAEHLEKLSSSEVESSELEKSRQKVLDAASLYNESLITQYFLEENERLLDKIEKLSNKSPGDRQFINFHQAKAFLCFKQGKYEESITEFGILIKYLGHNSRIYENLGLAYARIGKVEEAKTSYANALVLGAMDDSKTLLMGIATLFAQEADYKTSNDILDYTIEILEKTYTHEHSLVAKCLSAKTDNFQAMKDYVSAEKAIEESVRIFIKTCGIATPLTANALYKQIQICLFLKKPITDLSIACLRSWADTDGQSYNNSIFNCLKYLSKQSLDNDQERELREIKNKILRKLVTEG